MSLVAQSISASLSTLRIETRALRGVQVTQGGGECWSDKLGYLSVSVPCFSNNCRQSGVIQITFYYKLVLFAHHTLELCPWLVRLVFFFLSLSSSRLTQFFSVTCCSQLLILAVLLSASMPGSAATVAQQEKSLINGNGAKDTVLNANEYRLRTVVVFFFFWLFILRKMNIEFPIHHAKRLPYDHDWDCKMNIEFLLLTAVKMIWNGPGIPSVTGIDVFTPKILFPICCCPFTPCSLSVAVLFEVEDDFWYFPLFINKEEKKNHQI